MVCTAAPCFIAAAEPGPTGDIACAAGAASASMAPTAATPSSLVTVMNFSFDRLRSHAGVAQASRLSDAAQIGVSNERREEE